MKKMLLMLSVAALLGCAGTKDVYMFTSHREPALDGLHFLYSHDGLHWDSLPGSWLRPQIGNKELYRNYATRKAQQLLGTGNFISKMGMHAAADAINAGLTDDLSRLYAPEFSHGYRKASK